MAGCAHLPALHCAWLLGDSLQGGWSQSLQTPGLLSDGGWWRLSCVLVIKSLLGPFLVSGCQISALCCLTRDGFCSGCLLGSLSEPHFYSGQKYPAFQSACIHPGEAWIMEYRMQNGFSKGVVKQAKKGGWWGSDCKHQVLELPLQHRSLTPHQFLMRWGWLLSFLSQKSTHIHYIWMNCFKVAPADSIYQTKLKVKLKCSLLLLPALLSNQTSLSPANIWLCSWTSSICNGDIWTKPTLLETNNIINVPLLLFLCFYSMFLLLRKERSQLKGGKTAGLTKQKRNPYFVTKYLHPPLFKPFQRYAAASVSGSELQQWSFCAARGQNTKSKQKIVKIHVLFSSQGHVQLPKCLQMGMASSLQPPWSGYSSQ